MSLAKGAAYELVRAAVADDRPAEDLGEWFDREWAQRTGSRSVPVAPIRDAWHGSTAEAARLCGWQPQRVRRIFKQQFVQLRTAEFLCRALDIDPMDVGV